MRQASPPVSPEELGQWVTEAAIRPDAPDLGRLRTRLDAVRDRIRAATPQARSAEIRGYMEDFAAATRLEQSGTRAEDATPQRSELPWRSVGLWVFVAIVTAASARVDRDNPLTAGIARATWFGVPVLLGAAQAGLECARTRVRAGRARAVLASVVAYFIAMAFISVVSGARGCADDAAGLGFLGAISVGLGGLAGIASAERGNRDWKVVPEAVIIAVPFGILYVLMAAFSCSRWL